MNAISTITKCANCMTNTRCRHRDFNAQVWSILFYWDEIEKSAVDEAICDDCYHDLRNVLIERGEEMEQLLQEGVPDKPAVKRQLTAPVAKKAKPLPEPKPVEKVTAKASTSKSSSAVTKTPARKKAKKAKIA